MDPVLPLLSEWLLATNSEISVDLFAALACLMNASSSSIYMFKSVSRVQVRRHSIHHQRCASAPMPHGAFLEEESNNVDDG